MTLSQSAGFYVGSEPFGVSLGFGYDSNGNRTTVTDSFGGETDSVYNSQGQLISETYSDDGTVELRIDQTYNTAGEVATQTRYSDNGVTVVAETYYTYNTAGEVTDILTEDADGSVIDDFAYTYDSHGELLTETDNGTLVASYTYDQSGPTVGSGGLIPQLISDGTNSYSYDPAGNRTGDGYVVGTGNELLSDSTYNYTYDADGNETSKTDIATGDKWTYGYNALNQMISAIETTADGTVETEVDYKYDALDNRVEQDVTTGGTTTVQRYAYDDWNPAKSTPIGNENNDVWADLDGDSSLTTRYIRGDAVDQLFARVDGAGASDPAGVYWTVTDRLGSVRAVLDANGKLKDSIAYDGFGNITTETDPTYGGRYKYTGREFDVETQLQYNRERYYDARTGRWTTQDPLGFDAGDSNLYRYVNNSPTMGTDPSGLDALNDQLNRQFDQRFQTDPNPPNRAEWVARERRFYEGFQKKGAESDLDRTLRGMEQFKKNYKDALNPQLFQPLPRPGTAAHDQAMQLGHTDESRRMQAADAAIIQGILRAGGTILLFVPGGQAAGTVVLIVLDVAQGDFAGAAVGGLTLGLAPAIRILRVVRAPARSGFGGGLGYTSERISSRMVAQETLDSCQVACARQLLRDAGIEISECELRSMIPVLERFGSNAADTAAALNRLHPGLRYSGGGVMPENLATLLRRDPWIASVGTDGGRIHAIIIDGVSGNNLLVRDPWGVFGTLSARGTEATIPMAEFLERWRRGVHQVVIPVGLR